MTTKTAVRTKKPNALEVMAAGMREVLVSTGARYVHRRLSHGLELVLQCNDHRWRLALGRCDVPPSDDEVTTCRKAFGVPVGAEEARTMKDRTNPKTAITTEWHICELTWMEA